MQAAAQAIQPTRAVNTILQIAYFALFVPPLLLVADVLNSWRAEGIQSKVEVAVLVICGARLIGMVVALRVSGRERVIAKSRNWIVFIYATMLALALAESIARIVTYDPFPVGVLYPPNTQMTMDTDRMGFPGMHGIAHYSINELGLRGPSLRLARDAYRIITVGGSTTEAGDVDDPQAWPQKLMDELNRAQKRVPVWVSNAGMSGHATVDHLAMMRRISALLHADALVFLIGVNDLHETLHDSGAPTQRRLEQGTVYFVHHFPFFKRLRLYRLAQRIYYSRPQRQAEFYNFWRERLAMRAAAPSTPLPPLGIGLTEYRERVLAIARECSARGQRCIFLTQPALWRADMPREEQQWIWFGWVDATGGFVSAANLATAMDRYNHALLEVCAANRLECYDAAAAIPKTLSYIYDDVHFTPEGNALLARFLAERLLATSPFTANQRAAGGH